MKKILIISAIYFPYHHGGAEISTQLLAEQLNSIDEYKVDVLTHSKDKSYVDNVNGVCVIRHYFGHISNSIFSWNQEQNTPLHLKIIGKAGDIFPCKKRREFYINLFKNYDVIVVSGNGKRMGIKDAWIAASNVHIPLVQIIRDPGLLYVNNASPLPLLGIDWFYRKIAIIGLKKVNYTVGISEFILNQYKKYGILLNGQKVIPNMIEKNICNQLSYNEKDNMILYVGTIGTYKGVKTLINAFSKITQEMPDYHLMLIGRKSDIKIPNDKKIIWKGHLPLTEVYEYMQKAKIIVVPSEWDEAFGRVLIEAVNNGTIVIGSDRGAIPEVLNYDKRFIFPAGNENYLAEMLMTFLKIGEKEYEQLLSELEISFRRFGCDINIKIWHQFISDILQNQ